MGSFQPIFVDSIRTYWLRSSRIAVCDIPEASFEFSNVSTLQKLLLILRDIPGSFFEEQNALLILNDIPGSFLEEWFMHKTDSILVDFDDSKGHSGPAGDF